MTAGLAIARIVVLVGPVVAYALGVRFVHRKLGYAALTALLGASLYVPARFALGWLRVFSSLDADSVAPTELTALVYAFFVAAPLAQGLQVAAVAPVWRSRAFEQPIDGVVYAAAAALGFTTAQNVAYLFLGAPEGLGPTARALVAIPAHLFFAAAWGYALARDPHKRLGGRWFNFTWLVATLFSGIFDHMAFARSLLAVVATLPILLCMAFVTWVGGRDLVTRGESPASRPSFARRFLPTIAPPSMQAVRAALRRTERPVTLTWIGFGALVTTGVLVAMLSAAVVFGHRVGIDFASVDRVDASAASALASLSLLGAAALGAFPFAGYLIARASSARSVLEPAISAGVAIAGSLVLLGLAAPVAVVFAIAFAPVAFGLACAGAWMGMAK